MSAFATTEFQAVQFMPLFVVPQILLCGLFVARDQLPPVLEAVSNVLPLSYAVDAMQSPGVDQRDRGRLARRPRSWPPSRSPRWPSARPPCGGVRPDPGRPVGE